MNTDSWHNGYVDAQRTFLVKNETGIRRRLNLMGVLSLPLDARILDFGCGTGEMMDFLHAEGFLDIVGLEPDERLVQHREKKNFVIGKGPELCFKDHVFDAVVSMGVLHHFDSMLALRRQVDEFHRVLRPGGALIYMEPTNTIVRKVLTPILMSPLVGLTQFSRQKRLMVLEEWETLKRWLSQEKSFPEQFVVPAGFEIRSCIRRPLKSFLHAVKRS